MEYFWGDDRVVYAYTDAQVLGGLADGKVPLTSAEIDSVLNPKPTQFELENTERMWRDLELSRTDIELSKVIDADSKAFGTIDEWKAYRRELRAWPEQVGFPQVELRPSSPDAPEVLPVGESV